jgi:probable rRNA maturation factor
MGVLHVVWSSRERVRALNRRFRHVRRFTDVIAFRYGDIRPVRHPVKRELDAPFGDIYIAVPQARLNARRFRVPFGEELARLSVHGTLHLLGYTDYTSSARKTMWAMQEKIIQKLMAYIPRATKRPS